MRILTLVLLMGLAAPAAAQVQWHPTPAPVVPKYEHPVKSVFRGLQRGYDFGRQIREDRQRQQYQQQELERRALELEEHRRRAEQERRQREYDRHQQEKAAAAQAAKPNPEELTSVDITQVSQHKGFWPFVDKWLKAKTERDVKLVLLERQGELGLDDAALELGRRERLVLKMLLENELRRREQARKNPG